MENNNNNANNNGTASENNNEKLFTQDDVNRIVCERLSRIKSSTGSEDSRVAELDQRERKLYVREQVASGKIPEELGELFETLDKDTTDKVMNAFAPYLQKVKEPILNSVGKTGGKADSDPIRQAMGLKG